MCEENQIQLVPIEASVMPQTAQALEKLSHDADLTKGEVIDRLTLKMTARQVEYAVQLANEEVMMCLSGLNHEDFQVAFHSLMVNLAAAMDAKELEQLVGEAKAKQEELMQGFADMPQEDMEALKKALEQMAADQQDKSQGE